ncbi:thialysine N-epsilon-acetyltransferase [Diabrotica virgifera virgifera]|uniref:Diamine acetyltransferase 2-like n=1 Tax=Diabrotica virgifera virgifera TaxID=50390 RepID=A0A6P7F781_DIAVI|nr:thialysine N-epsilon-acetyltransferase [Diabrotica virgifera virgifera]
MSSEKKESDAVIRRAEKKDMKAVMGLIKELAAFEKLENQVKIDHTVLEEDGFGADGRPYFGCLVAELPDTGNIVAYALYFYSYSTWEGKSIFLEDLYVQPDYRIQGIGKKLFLAVMKTAVDSGYKRVDFHVLAWNPAISFYKRMGAVDLSESEEWKLFRMDHSSLKALFQ